MHKVKSLDKIIQNIGTIFIIETPVSVERNNEAMFKEFAQIEIDGTVFTPKGFERYCLATPLRIGENIGILVDTPQS